MQNQLKSEQFKSDSSKMVRLKDILSNQKRRRVHDKKKLTEMDNDGSSQQVTRIKNNDKSKPKQKSRRLSNKKTVDYTCHDIETDSEGESSNYKQKTKDHTDKSSLKSQKRYNEKNNGKMLNKDTTHSKRSHSSKGVDLDDEELDDEDFEIPKPRQQKNNKKHLVKIISDDSDSSVELLAHNNGI